MTKKILGLTVVGLACALSLAQADQFGQVDMQVLKTQAAGMPTPAARRPRGEYSPTRAERVNVSLGRYHTYAYLPNCGGTVSLRIVRGKAVVAFAGVKQCSNFDILKNNLEPVNYGNEKLYGPLGDRFRSFEIPQQILDYGYNSIVVAMRSNNGPHQDLIELELFY